MVYCGWGILVMRNALFLALAVFAAGCETLSRKSDDGAPNEEHGRELNAAFSRPLPYFGGSKQPLGPLRPSGWIGSSGGKAFSYYPTNAPGFDLSKYLGPKPNHELKDPAFRDDITKAAPVKPGQSLQPNGGMRIFRTSGMAGPVADVGFDLTSYSDRNLGKCPSARKMAERIRKPETSASCVRDSNAALGLRQTNAAMNFYNSAMLEGIKGIKGGGGYHYKQKDAGKIAPGGINTMINFAKGVFFPASSKSSHCTGAVYTYLLNGFRRIDDRYFSSRIFSSLGTKPKKLKNFEIDGSFHTAFNSNNWSINDANNYGKFGVNFGEKQANLACPGDPMLIDKTNGNGHSVVFLGHEASEGNVYYWSSNSDTGGYGVSCYPLKLIQDIHFTRVTDPGNLVNIPDDGGVAKGNSYVVKEGNPKYVGIDYVRKQQRANELAFQPDGFADEKGLLADHSVAGTASIMRTNGI